MFVFMWKHFEFQAAITRVYAKSVMTKVLKPFRFHAPSTAYYVRYVKLVLAFIRQVSLCDALPLFGVDIL